MVTRRRVLIAACCLVSVACVSASRYPEVNANGTCANGVHDGSETGTDCGGEVCPICEVGQACVSASDCSTLECLDGVCATPQCADGRKSGSESDVDCGGACPPCAAAAACSSAFDCAFGTCESGRCVYLRQELVVGSTPQPIGRSLAMSDQLLFAGATWATGQPATSSLVQRFRRGNTGAWSNDGACFTSNDTALRPGAALALSLDASVELLFVGSPGDALTPGHVRRMLDTASSGDSLDLTPDDSLPGDGFGSALAVGALGGGQALIVGAPLRLTSGLSRGEAYLFTVPDSFGASMPQLVTLWSGTPSSAHFGASVAGSADLGAVVGAPGDANQPGFVRVFLGLDGAGHTVTAPTPTNDDAFGSGVAVFGTIAAVAARGAAYTFERANPGVSVARALPLSAEAKASGVVVSVAVSQRWVAVGVPMAHGRVELFTRVDGTFVRGPVIQSDALGDGFGTALAVTTDRLVVGAPLTSPNGRLVIFGL